MKPSTARIAAAFSVLATMAFASPAYASINYYLEISPNGPVSTAPTTEVKTTPPNSIKVASFSFGAPKAPLAGASQLSGAGAGKVAARSLTVTGVSDPTVSQQLLQDMLAATALHQVRLLEVKDVANKSMPVETIVLSNVYVTSDKVKDKNGKATDTYDFNYMSAEFEQASLSTPTGSTGTPIVKGWNRIMNEPVPGT